MIINVKSPTEMGFLFDGQFSNREQCFFWENNQNVYIHLRWFSVIKVPRNVLAATPGKLYRQLRYVFVLYCFFRGKVHMST